LESTHNIPVAPTIQPIIWSASSTKTAPYSGKGSLCTAIVRYLKHWVIQMALCIPVLIFVTTDMT